MKNGRCRSLIVTVFVLSLTFTAWPATYYVDAVNGVDTRAGTSPATAWKTLQKVNNRTFSPGDSVLLHRAQEWRERLFISSSGTSGSPITFGAYDTGAAPLINGANVVIGWSLASTNRYQATVTVAPEVVMFDGVKGTRASTLAEVNAANEWYWASNTLTVYSEAAPSNVEASARRWLVECYANDYVTVQDLAFRYGVDCARLIDTTNITLDNLVIYDCAGYAGVIMGSTAAGRGTNNLVQNCFIQGITGSQESITLGGYGHGVFLWGQNLCGLNRIEGNQIHDNGGGGILLIDTSDNAVAGNTVYRHGSAGITVSGLESSGNVIEGNELFENCRTVNDCFAINLYMPGNNNIVRYNITHDQYVFTDEQVGIPGFTERSGGIRYDGDAAIGVSDKTGNRIYSNLIYNEYEGVQIFNYSHVSVYNNTIVNSARSGLYVGCINVAGSSTGNAFYGNVVALTDEHLVWHNGATNTLFDNNVYYSTQTASFDWNGTHYNFTGWKSHSGQDAASQVADPLFQNVSSLDFHLRLGSPAIDRGNAIGAGEADILGVARPQGSAVDAGAYEYVETPTAAFTATPLTGVAALTVQFTDASTPGTSLITAWAWDFDNDGTIDSAEQHPSHTYETWGKFSVSLTVTTSAGTDTHVELEYINVTSGPSADFSATPTTGSAPLSVTFTDTSTVGSSPIVSWAWDFDNDGTIDSGIQQPTHVFGAGVYSVSLTITTLDGQSDTRVKTGYITVVVPPEAAFSADITSGAAPLTVQFTDESTAGSAAIDSWEWDFGDGEATSAAQHPAHTYTTAGTYAVSLRVTTAAGTDTELKTGYITVSPGVAPVASFTATPVSGLRPLTVQFTDTSTPGTSPITAWRWDFGDGQTSTAASPAHTYESTGTFTVSLEVTTVVGVNSLVRSNLIQVIPASLPEAEFTSNITIGASPLSVQFSDLSQPGSHPITGWAWNFGDGQFSSLQNPLHIYAAPGVYTVSLAVTTEMGTDTLSKAAYLRAFKVVYVDRGNTSGVENGVSWSTAFTAIQTGIETALAAGVSDVWVAEGTYGEVRDNGSGALTLRSGVSVYGGFAGDETVRAQRDWTLHPTIIDGSTSRNGSRAYHVVLGANNATLDGFTIQGGRADNSNQSWDRGAGLYNNGVSPTIAHCIFNANEASYAGGAVYNGGGAAPLISCCRFNANNASGSLFSAGMGGAMYNYDSAAPNIVNCVFQGNTASAALFSDGNGGAIYNRSSSPVITNCTFSQNRTYGTLFSDGNGGAIYNNNSAATILNGILWDDYPNEIYNQSSTPSVNYSDVEGGYASGSGNLNVDPQFTDASSGDFTLPGGSPCVNAGALVGAPAEDYLGVVRPQDGLPDQGAYEFGIAPSAAFSATPTAGAAPLAVQFTDASDPGTSPITGWLWDFGDGGSSTEQNPLHTYPYAGEYAASLTVTTSAGSDTSAPQSISAQESILFLEQPASLTVYVGTEVSFTVAVQGGQGALDFQWWYDDGKGQKMPVGDDLDSMALPPVVIEDSGWYSCEVSDGLGTYESEPAHLSVYPHLAITENPIGGTRIPGESFTFQVDVSGGIPPISYGWRKGETPIDDANTKALTLLDLEASDAGVYYVDVLDSGGDVRCSAPATLQVFQGLPAAHFSGLAALAIALAGAGVLYARRAGQQGIR